MLRENFFVTPQRILELSSWQGIVDFFRDLGYTTSSDATPEKDAILRAELHRHADLNSRIVQFRSIAYDKDETFSTLYIYLYVLKSVTVKTRDDIIYDLDHRNSGQYLLLLTTDSNPFNELECVFLDRFAEANQQTVKTSQKTVVQTTLFEISPVLVGPLRTRTLSVDCRHPDYKAVRFLRELSYTHRSVLEQCRAISRAFDNAETREEFFSNRSLFSDYYLKQRLPEEVSEWTRTTQPGFESETLTEASNELRRLYAGASKEFAGKSSTELRPLLFDKVLALLGFRWQTTSKTRGGQDERQPDYIMSMKESTSSQQTLCLAYPWDRPLDDALSYDEDDIAPSTDPTAQENPGAVVVSLLEQKQANWIILTNGRLWRLYSAKARSRATNYYEIDLTEVLAIRREQTDDALTALRYFWLFFRASAFEPMPRPDYETPPYLCFLDYMTRESERYARALEKSLKNRIFDEIFPFFAGGFVRYAQHSGGLPQDLQQQTPEERAALLQPFFEGTLAFLYRLLFLLYAESRDLLPVHDARYAENSLTSIKEEIAKIAKNNKAQARQNIEARFRREDVEEPNLYQRLQVLFTAIDKGSEDLNVPTYNGGLFMTSFDASKAIASLSPDEKAARFLSTYKIPDRELALGLDLMARDEDAKKGKSAKHVFELVYVDYKSLGVRQLGSIYEGLLEFKLRIAIEDMVVLKGKVVPRKDAIADGRYTPGRTKAITYEPNTIYIENDRHERKATGSYYTPDYIVKYIIEHTVGPILQEKFDKLRKKFQDYQRKVQQITRDNEHFGKRNEPLKNVHAIYLSHAGLVEEFFDVKVLDPAMGSGHFLVDTVDYITDKMAEFLRPFTPNPVQQNLQEIRSTIVAAVEVQRVSIDRTRLNELNLLKRQVLKRCVFGVDVNYMAVTLTKVSLWLDTFTQGAPLSFLDYHLKWGNSLLGTTIATLQKESADGSWLTSDLTSVLSVAELARRLSMGTDATPQALAEAHELYEQLIGRVQPYKALLNVWVSQYFGDKWAKTTVETGVDAVLKQNIETLMPANYESYMRAQELAASRNKNFFHWDLEFPEVFFKNSQLLSEDNAGFDAVIGNPPYINANELNKGLSEYEKPFWKIRFSSAAGAYDLYILFLELTIKLARNQGLVALITPNKFLSSPYAVAFRDYCMNSAKNIKFTQSLESACFEDPSVYPVVTVLKAEMPKDSYNIEIEIIDDYRKLLPRKLTKQESQSLDKLPERIWGFLISESLPLLLKAQKASVELHECSLVNASSTASEADIYEIALTNDFHEDSKRFINTGLIDRYTTLWGLNPLTHKGHTLTTPYLDVTNAIVSTERKNQYNKPKIIFAKMAQKIEAFYDINAEFASANTNFVYSSTYDLYYLLAILNSNLMSIVYDGYFGSLIMSGGYFQYQAPQLRILPIRRINFITPQDLLPFYLDDAKLLYQQFITNGSDLPLLNFVGRCLTQQPEASDVVHDLLAFLAESMLDLNKEKRILQENFLKNLEVTLEIQPQTIKTSSSVGLASLKGKDRLLNYPRDYRKEEKALPFKDIENILLENKRRFRQYLDNKRLRDIESEYTQNVEVIERIKQQLKLTDDLIDSIVYKLYGLTDDEIDIVGTSKYTEFTVES